MHPRLSYCTSAAIHALLAWCCATVNSTILIEFTVRSGQAVPLVSRAATAQPVTIQLNSRLTPDDQPDQTTELAISSLTPPTAAELDHVDVKRAPLEDGRRRPLRSDQTWLPKEIQREQPEIQPIVAAPELVGFAAIAPATVPQRVESDSRPSSTMAAVDPAPQTPDETPPLMQSLLPRERLGQRRSLSRPPVEEFTRPDQPIRVSEMTRKSPEVVALTNLPAPEVPEPIIRPPITSPLKEVEIAEVQEPAEASPSAMQANDAVGAKVDRLPKPLPENREPVYPDELRRRRVGGRVLLAVTIGKDGRVTSVRIVQSSGQPLLDESALEAIRDWRFSPAIRGQLAVPYAVHLPVSFSIRG